LVRLTGDRPRYRLQSPLSGACSGQGSEKTKRPNGLSRRPSDLGVRIGRTLPQRCGNRGYGSAVSCCCRMSPMSDCSMCPLAFTSLRKLSSSAECPLVMSFFNCLLGVGRLWDVDGDFIGAVA